MACVIIGCMCHPAPRAAALHVRIALLHAFVRTSNRAWCNHGMDGIGTVMPRPCIKMPSFQHVIIGLVLPASIYEIGSGRKSELDV